MLVDINKVIENSFFLMYTKVTKHSHSHSHNYYFIISHSHGPTLFCYSGWLAGWLTGWLTGWLAIWMTFWPALALR